MYNYFFNFFFYFHQFIFPPSFFTFSINDGNEVYLNAEIVYYSLLDNNIDTLSTHRFEIGNIDLSKSMEGFVTSGPNNLYYAFQDQLFLWNVTTDTLISCLLYTSPSPRD